MLERISMRAHKSIERAPLYGPLSSDPREVLPQALIRFLPPTHPQEKGLHLDCRGRSSTGLGCNRRLATTLREQDRAEKPSVEAHG